MTASIIVAPPHLNFHSTEPEQKFEIFNVNQFPVKFVVKATAPEKYIISNTEGMINTQCKVSIVVTHVDLCVTNENIRDKFRIYFSVLKNKKFEPIGHRDITAVLYPHKRASQSPSRMEGRSQRGETTSPARRSSHSSTLSTHSTHSTRSLVPQPPAETPPPEPANGHHLLVYLVPMVLGVGALWLPTQDSIPDTPWYLELSVITKHTICFFLGVLVTLFYKRVQQTER